MLHRVNEEAVAVGVVTEDPVVVRDREIAHRAAEVGEEAVALADRAGRGRQRLDQLDDGRRALLLQLLGSGDVDRQGRVFGPAQWESLRRPNYSGSISRTPARGG